MIKPRSTSLCAAKWGWACRTLNPDADHHILAIDQAAVGDVLIAQVEAIRNHTRLMDGSASRVRLYDGDLVVGVLGHRYATDAYDARAEIQGGRVDLLTNAGMMGRVERRHSSVSAPTRLRVLGQLADANHRPINLIDRSFRPRPMPSMAAKVILVVGTGMNAGKTTTAARLAWGLTQQGLTVAALKATGSVSPNDSAELRATGAAWVRDFSDYGVPSTHRMDLARLDGLVGTMLADAEDQRPDVILVELADGVLQTETEALLRSPWLHKVSLGALLAAPCALSALMGISVVQQAGLSVLGVSGLISNAPLFVNELRARTAVPVMSSAGDGRSLGRAIAPLCRADQVYAA